MWKKLTAEDLASKLSQREIDAYSRSSFAQTEPVDALLDHTVEEVRGFIASGRKCVLDPNESTIPAMLTSAVLDYVTFNLLKRINQPVSDPRTKAYDRAVALFDKLATGAIVPPDGGENATPKESFTDLTRPSIAKKPRTLGRQHESGI